MSSNPTEPTPSPTPVTGYFEGERLELNWRYAYRPEFVPLLIDYLGAQSDTHILDVGCGTGFLARLLAHTLDSCQVVGLEADEALLNLGRQMVDKEGLADQVTLKHGDAYQIPFPADSFDMVTSHTLL
jgi:ubiquinone/menaquinone biosynthesis C-methylase UbiE